MAMAPFVKSSLVMFGLTLPFAASAQPVGDDKPAAAKPSEKAEKSASGDKPAVTPNPPVSPPASPPAPGAAANNGNILVEKTGSGQKLFRITEGLVVEGQRQKPNAFYVLQRASTPYDWETLEENFLPRILKAAEKPPF